MPAPDFTLDFDRLRRVGGLTILTFIGFSEFVLHSLPPSDPRRAEVQEIIKAGSRAADVTLKEGRPLILTTLERDEAMRAALHAATATLPRPAPTPRPPGRCRARRCARARAR